MAVVTAVLPDGSVVALGDNPVTLPATTVIPQVAHSRSGRARLDGRSRAITGEVGLLPMDLTRSTGYHRLDIDGETYWFATEDAKLRLRGIERMLADLRQNGTSWGGQIIFSTGDLLRDVHVVYGWLDEHADTALTALDAVAARPVAASKVSRRVARDAGPGVDVARTNQLLRRNPSEHLVARETGVVQVDDRTYDPVVVVRRSRERTFETVWNRRAFALLTMLGRLVAEVLGSESTEHVINRCHEWRSRLTTTASRPFFRALARSFTPASALGAGRSSVEISDRSYRTIADTTAQLTDLGWRPSLQPIPRYAYVGYSDAIFQAWCASTIAAALGLAATSPTLGERQPAYCGEQFDLYYDTVLPPNVAQTWRAASIAPDQLRPDLTIHERETGRIAIIDAKYRATGDATTESARKEVISYMASFGLSAAGIAFPALSAQATPLLIEGQGNQLLEMSLAPDVIPDALGDLVQTLLRVAPY